MAYGGGLENRFRLFWRTWVRIPPPPPVEKSEAWLMRQPILDSELNLVSLEGLARKSGVEYTAHYGKVC